MPQVEAAIAVNNIWVKTLESYKKDLSKKDLLVVEAITSPADVAHHIKDLEAKKVTGKSGAFADRVHAIIGRLTQFSNVIGAVTSSNTEASLIWGSLKLLLTIVQQSSEEYEKICKSLLAVSDSFPVIELVTETFKSSELICGHVAEFYTSVLRFWSKALKFYKRRRIFNILRAWHDFDSEFGDLDRDMKRHRKNIEKAAAAVHMNESRAARLEQTALNQELMDTKASAERLGCHREIVKWLAPMNHEANYFEDALRSASESRHPGTCMWILNKPEFHAWENSGPNDTVTRLLWLTGVPGAGKTVLSSSVINRCYEVSGKLSPIIYFFFKLTDNDKNSRLAVTRSLLYQLYSLIPANLATEISSLKDNSGKETALSEQGLWDLFTKHAKDVNNLIIVLDALDECNGVDVLLRRLSSLLQCSCAKVFVVSRKEENIAVALADYTQIVISHDNVEADIRSYVTAEIKKIPRFQGKSVQQRMIHALSSGHGGMFLWAYLMVKELKELGTVRQVDDALRSLPSGLEELHEAIITRLDSTLHKAHRELATKILTWVVCAVRPLRLSELQEILQFETRQDRIADQPFDDDNDDDDLLYSEKDIELACGALVMTRNETLQLIHLSTKEILTRRPEYMGSDDSRLGFYVNAQRENPHMAVLCVSYISAHLEGIDSVTRPCLDTASRLQFSTKSYDSTELVANSPFIDYASISWQAHLVDGQISLELEDVISCLQTLLTYDLTTKWIELCVSLHQDITWTLERGCNEIKLWGDYALVPSNTSCYTAIGFLWAWSSAVVSVIAEYGRVIEEFPYEIHFLDLARYFSNEGALSPALLPASYTLSQGQDIREPISQVCAIEKDPARAKVEPCRQLHSNVQNPSQNSTIGFLLYDSIRDVYFSAEKELLNDTEVLWAQDRATGRRMLPVKSSLNILDVPYKDSAPSFPEQPTRLVAAVLCPAHKYLAILYTDSASGLFITSLWLIERHLHFQGIRDLQPWARRLHCVACHNYLFVDSCLPLTVGQEGFFYCPSGQMHPEHGIRRRIPDLFASDVREWSQVILAFSGNGQILIRLDRWKGLLDKYLWLEDKGMNPLPWASLPVYGRFLTVSQTARFGIYEFEPRGGSAVTVNLLDDQANQQQLQIQGSAHQVFFYFSQDEKSLFGIYATGMNADRRAHFSRWAVTDPSFVPQAETSLSVPSFLYSTFYVNSNICVVEKDSMVILLNQDRELYELDLKSLAFNRSTISASESRSLPHQSYCEGSYELSNDGHCLVAYYVTCPKWSDSTKMESEDEQSKSLGSSKTRVELRFVELFGLIDQVRKIELLYSDPNTSANHHHLVTFSPDLSLVQAGPHVFDLLAPDHPKLSFSDHSLLFLGGKPYQHICFSSCNRYLVVIQDRNRAAKEEHATCRIFQIYRTARRIEWLTITGLESTVVDGFWAAFHPNLNLLLLTIRKERGIELKDARKDIAKAIEVVEIDLAELKAVPIGIPKCDLRQFYGTSEPIEHFSAGFSSCGAFCFMDVPDHGFLMLNSIHLGKRRAEIQMPAIWVDLMSYNGRFYTLSHDINISVVTLDQAIDRTHRNGLRDCFDDRSQPEHRISIRITTFPNHLANTTPYLLLGKDEDDFVRVLFLPWKEGSPPEIKQLRVTMNQILAKLEEAARAVEPNIEQLFREEFDEGSEEESSDYDEDDEEEISTSADEEEEESIGAKPEEIALSATEDEQASYESDENGA